MGKSDPLDLKGKRPSGVVFDLPRSHPASMWGRALVEPLGQRMAVSSCYVCPMFSEDGAREACSIGGTATYNDAVPDDCPIRKGPMVVYLHSEVEG